MHVTGFSGFPYKIETISFFAFLFLLLCLAHFITFTLSVIFVSPSKFCSFLFLSFSLHLLILRRTCFTFLSTSNCLGHFCGISFFLVSYSNCFLDPFSFITPEVPCPSSGDNKCFPLKIEINNIFLLKVV